MSAGGTAGSLDGSNVRPLTHSKSHAVPGSPGYIYCPGEWVKQQRGSGDHAQWVTVLDWCPTVTAHLGGYSPRGELVKRTVTVMVGGDSATVRISDIEDGSVWERFPMATGTHKRDIREALANLIDDQASRMDLAPLHPRWVDGRLMLPPAAALARGYAVTSGTPDDWKTLLLEIAKSPRMALVVGLAIGGLYVLPLGRDSYTVHLPGVSSEGKTTTNKAAASFFGNPNDVIVPWSVTKQGPGSWLRSMVIMTGFRDELGASSMNAVQLETMIFTLMQGAERDMSSKTGDYRESQGSWHGALISTGNESIVGQIANEGVGARVVEITGPFTLSAKHADRICELSSAVHGHGLLALADRGPTPAQFAGMAGSVLAAISDTGGVVGRLAGHLSLGVAGAYVLAELAGCPEFARPVLAAARGVLNELAAGLAERGARPGDRLLDALRGSLASEPTAWPTKEHYVKTVQGTGLQPLAREILGWDLVGTDEPGDLAVIPSQLRKIVDAAGIHDSGIAIKDLRRRDLLIADNDGKHLQRRIRVGERTQRAYVVRGVLLDDPPETKIPEPRQAEPCATCQLPGPMCAPGSVVEDALPCVCCGVPTQVRAACGSPRTGVCQGLGFELPPAQPAPSPIRRGAHPAAAARTEARTAAQVSSIETLESGGSLRLLAALETTHLPMRRGEDGRMRKPFMRPQHPGITFAAHVVTGWAWSRPFDGPVSVLDRSGAWIAAASSVEVGHGELKQTGEIEFEGAPGYYQIIRHPWTETRLPDPLSGAGGDTLWVPGPTVGLLAGLVAEGRWPDVSILDAYTSVGVRLRKWTDYVNKLREVAITKYGRDSNQYTEVKTNFGEAMSLMLGAPTVPRKWKCGLQRPDWVHSIQSQASATLWRWADDCLKMAPELGPVSLREVDELLIPSAAVEIVTATERPGGRSPMVIDPDGIKLGSFKVKAVTGV